jgi:hypothetical protein
MIKNRSLCLAMALGIGITAAPVQAEEAEKKQKPRADFGLQALKERFEAAAPEIGERVPDLPVYTASGESVRFRSLARDHYSVVVFGCLT